MKYQDANVNYLMKHYLSYLELCKIKISLFSALSAATASLLIPLYGASTSNAENLLLFSVAVWLAWNGLKVYRQREGQSIYLSTFKKITIYMILVMLVLNLTSLLQL